MSSVRDITYGDELNNKIFQGVEKIYLVAKAAYGPKAGNALIEATHGAPLLSRDGVTNVKKVFLTDAVEDMAAQVVKQASEKNNEKAGDGTSAVVILAYHLYKAARKLVSAGHNQMEVSRMIDEACTQVIAHIESIKRPVDGTLINDVATISAGDEALGELIAETIETVGVDGGVTVEDYPGIGIHNEIVDGFYFKRGFKDVRLINDYSGLRASYTNVAIFLVDNRISTVAEIAPIMETCIGNNIKQLVIIGEVSDDALSVLILSKAKGVIDVTVVDPPVFGGGRTLFLEDIAVLTGGKLLVSKPSDFDTKALGYAEKVIITEHSTTIIGADGADEDKEARIKEIREQLASEKNPNSLDFIRDRLAQLTGKIAVIRVGGSTEIEQQEAKLRVQDAVCAVQSAISGGIVPGGGVTLANVHGTAFDDAFREPFRQLLDNGGFNPDTYLAKITPESPWSGFNIRTLHDKIDAVDLLEEGIIDPAEVIIEVVRNASSVVSRLITTSVALTIKKEE